MDLRNVISVSRLNAYIRKLFWQDEYLRQVFVQGEIANLRDYRGHLYFSLKDEKSSIRAVMWQSDRKRLSVVPEEGMQVIVAGGVSVFERDGVYQIYVSYMEPSGFGALYAALEKLKEKLEKEGLFAQERKRPLPVFPRKIGLVTSIRGAAIKDIVSVGRRRYQGVWFVVADSKVQGEGAGSDIAAGIRALNQIPDIDVIIVSRGGGSQEDLFVFNDETVARAIFSSRAPVVSAIGHERDVTVADLVADVRAATPSAAAELVVPNANELKAAVSNLTQRAYISMSLAIESKRKMLSGLGTRPCLERPDWFLVTVRETLFRLKEDLEQAMALNIDKQRQKLDSIIAKLDALSPLKILSRGYSVTRTIPGLKIVKDYRDVTPGSRVLVNLHEGSLVCSIEKADSGEEVLEGK
ncbi:MAG: exodeoxyribonuclease VII large subunit [Bacillota bacterium]